MRDFGNVSRTVSAHRPEISMTGTEQDRRMLKYQLATLFQICALKQWDNWTYTHLSARLPGTTEFYINPFQCLYQDVFPDTLVAIDYANPDKESYEKVNPTGIAIHQAVYEARPDINCVVHLHTSAGVAVSSMASGLMPISQFALHFYGKIGRHSYDSLNLDPQGQLQQLTSDLGAGNALLLNNHGTLTVGRTIAEGFFFTHHLEEACRVQCMAMAAQTELIVLPDTICRKAHHDLLSFESDLGRRDWQVASNLLSESLRERLKT